MSTRSIPNPEIKGIRRNSQGAREGSKAKPQSVRDTRHSLYVPYAATLIAAGAAVLGYSVYRILSEETGIAWTVFALLTFITAAFSLKLPKSDIRVSVPDVFIFCSILLFGPAAGALTAAAEGLMGSLRAKTKSRRLFFAAFNMSAMSIAAFTAGKIYEVLGPVTSEAMAHVGLLQQVVFSVVVLAVYYFILNTGLLTIIISLEKRIGVIEVWMESFSWMGLGYLAAGLMAGMLSITAGAMNPVSVVLLAIVPVLTYMTYRQVIRLMRENVRLKAKPVTN